MPEWTIFYDPPAATPRIEGPHTGGHLKGCARRATARQTTSGEPRRKTLMACAECERLEQKVAELEAALSDLYDAVEGGGVGEVMRPGSALDSRIRRVLKGEDAK